jgi:hypothetical protein
MAGIEGLNFDKHALKCIHNIFNKQDWTYSSIYKIHNHIKDSETYFYTDDNIERIERMERMNTKNTLSLDMFGIKWDTDTFESTWNDFVFNLPVNSVRYALCNLEYAVYDPELPDSNNIIRNKVIFIMWAPMTAPVNERMQITMHALDVQKQIKQIGGIQYSIQANTLDDLHYNTIVKDIQKITCF